jgi:protein-serine/threonine kinase
MTQLFTSHTSPVASEKRNFHGLSLSSKKHSSNNNNPANNNNQSSNNDSSNNHFPSKIKNFFRLNSSGSTGAGNNGAERDAKDTGSGNNQAKTESKSRQSRFLPNIGRNRSTTVASEGNALDDGLSPTAHANPYFAHQGHPALRHRNEGSLPSTPPDPPELQVQGISPADQAITAGKEELARKLRRVASAPNTQGLFANDQSGERPKTAELGKEPLAALTGDQVQVTAVESSSEERGRSLPVPTAGPDGKIPSPGQIRASSTAAFRRTYSSNSIKVRNVEVGPGSFDKIKLIGKGDVGKVYLVREKKSNRLYAMKGE